MAAGRGRHHTDRVRPASRTAAGPQGVTRPRTYDRGGRRAGPGSSDLRLRTSHRKTSQPAAGPRPVDKVPPEVISGSSSLGDRGVNARSIADGIDPGMAGWCATRASSPTQPPAIARNASAKGRPAEDAAGLVGWSRATLYRHQQALAARESTTRWVPLNGGRDQRIRQAHCGQGIPGRGHRVSVKTVYPQIARE